MAYVKRKFVAHWLKHDDNRPRALIGCVALMIKQTKCKAEACTRPKQPKMNKRQNNKIANDLF